MVKITYIGNDLEYGVPLLIVLGLLFTTWTSVFVVCGLDAAFYLWIRGAILIPITFTVFLVLGATALALFYGIKLNNPKLVHVWYRVKIVECVLIITVILCNIPQMLWGNFGSLTGLLLIPCGIYLILCSKKIYYNMVPTTPIYQKLKIEPLTNEKVFSIA